MSDTDEDDLAAWGRWNKDRAEDLAQQLAACQQALERAEAEIATLRAERDQMDAWYIKAKSEKVAAEARLAALRPYLVHRQECHSGSILLHRPGAPMGTCSCGLADLLKEPTP